MFEDPKNWLIVGGIALGMIFGLVVKQTRFCLVAAVSSVSLIRDYRYAMSFALAIAVAILGTQLLEINGIVEISKASYRNASIDWMNVILGGLCFGVGASLAGGDAARIVVLAGEGNKTAWVAMFFFAIFASVAQFGLLEPLRLMSMSTSVQLSNGDAGLFAVFSLPQWLPLVVIMLLLAVFLIKNWKQHADTKFIIGGVIIGLTVIAAWYVTGVLAQDEFDPRPPSAMTVSGPMSRAGNLLVSGEYPTFSFSVAFVLGLFAVSLLVALLTRKFRFTSMELGSAARVALGGALMGIGGTLAYGCNIGQGFSGLSTLSLESVMAFISMVLGIHITMYFWERWRS